MCFFFPFFSLALPQLSSADVPPPQSARVSWRWKDEGNSDPTDQRIYTGEATVTWTRSAGCQTTGESNNWKPIISSTPVTVKAITKNQSRDFMDPKSVVHWGHTRTSKNFACDAHSRTDFTIYRGGDRSQRMIIRLPDVCSFFCFSFHLIFVEFDLVKTVSRFLRAYSRLIF